MTAGSRIDLGLDNWDNKGRKEHPTPKLLTKIVNNDKLVHVTMVFL